MLSACLRSLLGQDFEGVMRLIIADNGSLSSRLKPGRGLQIVSNLAKSLGGRLEYV